VQNRSDLFAQMARDVLVADDTTPTSGG
jgi:hypothetical protein